MLYDMTNKKVAWFIKCCKLFHSAWRLNFLLLTVSGSPKAMGERQRRMTVSQSPPDSETTRKTGMKKGTTSTIICSAAEIDTPARSGLLPAIPRLKIDSCRERKLNTCTNWLKDRVAKARVWPLTVDFANPASMLQATDDKENQIRPGPR